MESPAEVTVLVGAAGSGKTASALVEYGAAIERAAASMAFWRAALWLAPTGAAAAEVRDALAARAEKALLDPAATTFAGFAADVLRDAGVRLRPISSLQRRRLLRQVIGEAVVAGSLPYFAAVASSPGFLAIAEAAVGQIRRRGIDAAALTRGSRRGAEPRQADLIEVLRRYEQELESGGLIDDGGVHSAACHALADAPDLAGGMELVVADGFTDFTADEREVLRLLAMRARRMLVTIVGEVDGGRGNAEGGRAFDRDELFGRPDRAAKWLVEKLGGKIVRQPTTKSNWAAREQLERNLFRSHWELSITEGATGVSPVRCQEVAGPTAARTGDTPVAPSGIEIVAASSSQAEIEEIARRVKRLLTGEWGRESLATGNRPAFAAPLVAKDSRPLLSVAPGDIAVVFRSTREVAERVRHVFADYGIPFWLNAPRRLAATPLVRSLLPVLRLAAQDWPYRELLRAVSDRSLMLVREATSAAPTWPFAGEYDWRAAAELCVRYAQLPSGRRALLDQVAEWADGEDPSAEPSPAAASAARVVLDAVAADLDELPKRAGVAGWIDAAHWLASRLGLLGAISRAESAQNEWSLLAIALREAAQIDAWSGAAGRELALAEFVELVATAADETAGPHQRDRAGRVRVLSAAAARTIRVKHLFLGNLSEQSFPTSRAVGRTAEADGNSSPLEEASPDEMLLFYELVTRPTVSLTLSYPALDVRGQTLPPSPLLTELERCFPGAAVPRTVQGLSYAAQDSGVPLGRSELRRTAVREAHDGHRELLAALSLGDGVGGAILSGIEAVASRARHDRFSAFEGLAESDGVKAVLERRFGVEHLWSPSQLETYAGCPFRFFGEQVLKLRPMPELALASDVQRRGSLLHETMAHLYARRGGLEPADLTEAEAVAAISEQFQEVLNSLSRGRPARGLDAALREIERRQIAAWASRLAKQDAEYRAAWGKLDKPPTPTYFEARFGPANRRSQQTADADLSTERHFEVSLGSEQIGFTGQIDRIDVGRVGTTAVFNVIDYKSGAARVSETEMLAGVQLQLPLYAMAVEELLLAEQQAVPLAAGYWSVRGAGYGRVGRTGGPLTMGDVRDGGVSPAADWLALKKAVLARIAELVKGIRRGWFPVASRDKHCTEFCPLSRTCRIAQVRSLEKAWPPPANES